jgi:hypothetical protein
MHERVRLKLQCTCSTVRLKRKKIGNICEKLRENLRRNSGRDSGQISDSDEHRSQNLMSTGECKK